jgi:putative hydrolase of the HAD superfamily
VRALIFDFDGLVIDSERVMAEVFLDVMREHGGTVAIEEIAHLFGRTDADDEWDALILARCALSVADVLALMTPRVRAGVDALPLLPGVVELIDAAHAAGVKVGLGTGHDPVLLGPRLERLGLAFDAVVTSAEVARSKPAPDIFLEVARRLGVEPAACIVLEDSLPGCQAALAAGMHAIACPSSITADVAFPDGVRRVASLLEVSL